MLKKLAGVAGVAGVAALAACTSSAGYQPVEMTDADHAMQQRAFTTFLKDPGSADVMNVRVFQSAKGARMICGKVNAKNSFGGYTGYETFMVMTAPNIDYNRPGVNPIFGTGMAAVVDCGGAGYHS